MKAIMGALLLALGLCVLPSSPATADDKLPPPESDSWTVPSQFLACRGNAYALCYYSGPEIATPSRRYSDPPVMPCTPDPDNPSAADCTCYAVTDLPAVPDESPLGLQYQFNYVLMTSILNEDVRKSTLKECGPTGDDCLNLTSLESCAKGHFKGDSCKQADVCAMLGDIRTGTKQTLYEDLPDVELISTFSFENISQHSFGSTSCDVGTYAACMTAPCTSDEDGLTTCQCPTYDGPYQVGQRSHRLRELGLGCDISPNVWSAANRIKPPAE